MASRVLRVPVGLVVDALSAVDGGAGGGDALLLRRGLLVGVAEGRVHRLVVIGTIDMAGHFSHAAGHRTLEGAEKSVGIKGTSLATFLFPSLPKTAALLCGVEV